MPHYDIVIAGGSISGLLAAREIAAGGLSVLVLEEDPEIGTPEHCGGLVSVSGIQNLGIVPDIETIQNNKITRAKISSHSKSFEINAQRQNVIVLDRRALDKQIAFQAQKEDAQIKVKCAMRLLEKEGPHYIVRTSEGSFSCDFFVDARGISSLISRNREGVIPSAQYEVYAPWIEADTVEIVFDSQLYPGFFAWVIPTGQSKGKVGVAGWRINTASAVQSYLDSKGRHSVVRKVYAPIWTNGPIGSFVSGRTITIGDAAGQSKPTTAGGIYTCGMAGVLAGRALVASVNRENIEKEEEADGDDRQKQILVRNYESNWFSMFRTEFDKMLIARRLFERMDNKALDELVASLPPEIVQQASAIGDFDFHSSALAKMFGAKGAAKMARALLGNEIRRLFNES
ncbi:MAG: NAD(P)/FAD-dependent oxidoreductase [Thermoproteota archaeon]|nr:NAD(P)/FAD-dependent oxidoreductase [Thermoproteota archaeon]